jgi:hypothetical protein
LIFFLSLSILKNKRYEQKSSNRNQKMSMLQL